MKVLNVGKWVPQPFWGMMYRYEFWRRAVQRHEMRMVIADYSMEAPEDPDGWFVTQGVPTKGVEVVPARATSWARRMAWLASSLPPGPAFIERAMGERLRAEVDRVVLAYQPDVLVVWDYPLAACLGQIRGVGCRILVAVDSVPMVLRSRVAAERSLVRRAAFRFLASRYHAFERKYYPAYDHVVYVSPVDAEYAALPDTTSVVVITNGVDTNRFRPSAPLPVSQRPSIVFHGHLDYWPNRECVKYLIGTLGPVLQERLGADGFRIRVMGDGSRSGIRPVPRPAWFEHAGFVDDIVSELAAGTLYVAALPGGGGVKNKVLEAMACGLPVIGTSDAFSAMTITPGVHACIAGLEELPREVLSLLDDSDRLAMLRKNARDWALTHGSWDAYASHFEQLFIKQG